MNRAMPLKWRLKGENIGPIEENRLGMFSKKV